MLFLAQMWYSRAHNNLTTKWNNFKGTREKHVCSISNLTNIRLSAPSRRFSLFHLWILIPMRSLFDSYLVCHLVFQDGKRHIQSTYLSDNTHIKLTNNTGIARGIAIPNSWTYMRRNSIKRCLWKVTVSEHSLLDWLQSPVIKYF